MIAAEYLWKFAERAGDGWAVVVAPGGVREVRHTCGLALHVWDQLGVPLADGCVVYQGGKLAAIQGAESPAACMGALVAHFAPLRVALASARAALVVP